MKLFYILFQFIFISSQAQIIDSLNTARACMYMTPEEREMVYEINRVRSNASSYLQYVEPLLADAIKDLKENGRGPSNYSLTFTYSGVPLKKQKKVDTTWHYINEENVKALQTLVNDLKKLKKLSVLKPDSGIYLAAKKHRADQHAHAWMLNHMGSDGSAPWDRITKFSPRMLSGNENIAGSSGAPAVREIVLQLLIDAGIPGYGHRYNLLDPQWTHVACVAENYQQMYWWIQNFGSNK